MDLGIEGRVAIVTGASKGLGRASAAALVAEGCKVVICARTEDDINAAERQLRDDGGDVAAIVGDVSHPGTAARVTAFAVDRFGRLDILVGNIGGPGVGD